MLYLKINFLCNLVKDIQYTRYYMHNYYIILKMYYESEGWFTIHTYTHCVLRLKQIVNNEVL